MKRFMLSALALALSVFVSGQTADASGQEKTTLLHNGHLITVADPAVPAHLAHGDTIPGGPPPKAL